MIILVAISIFISVALLTGVVLFPVLTRRSIIQERLARLGPQQGESSGVGLKLIAQQTQLQEFLTRLGKKLPLSPKEQPKYTRMIVAAGFRKEGVLIFIGVKIVLAMVLPAAFVFFYALPKFKIMNSEALLYTLGLAIIGFLLPSAWLNHRVESRKRTIFHTFPDILDLMAVCVEAGLGMDAAIMKICSNPQFAGNPLVEEFRKASMEVRAGKPRMDALRDMAERTMVDDIRAFVTMLVQTEKFGTSIGQALRVHSDSLRTKRRQIAEEAAAKTAIKMLFPLVFFVFPALMVVILGPAMLNIRNLLFK